MPIRGVKNFIEQSAFKLTAGLMVAVGILVAGQVRAATLYLSPSFGSSSVGKTFSVSVYVSSNSAINAASGVVSFSKDNLEIASLSKSGSIFNLWVAEPFFSQSAGNFSFEGIVLNPGYTGTYGKILSINFRVKSAGTAKIAFSSGAILANDGEGTNILTGFGSSTFNLVGETTPKPTTPTVEAPKPTTPTVETPKSTTKTPIPRISSDTNPDQTKWYASNRVRLSWPVPAGVTALRLLLSSTPNDVPIITYSPPITSKELTNVSDGVYYFSARFQDANGWGEVARYVLRIDTKAPEKMEIISLDGATTTNLQPRIQIATTDSVSSIDYYSIKINEEAPIIIKPQDLVDGAYALLTQTAGLKNIIIEVYDKAGNKISAETRLEIQGGAPATAISKNLALTSWPAKLKVGDFLTIKGQTTGINKVIIYWQKDNEPVAFKEVVSNVKGSFVFTTTIKEAGNYQFWAIINDEQGLTIAGSEKVNIAVSEGIVTVIGQSLKQFWWVLILLALIALVFLVVKFYLKHGRHQKHQYINKVLYSSLHLLRDGIKEQLKILVGAKSKRRLSKEETAVMDGLKRTLTKTDRFLAKEITLIKKRKKK